MRRVFITIVAIIACGCGTRPSPVAKESSPQDSSNLPATNAAPTNRTDLKTHTDGQRLRNAAQQTTSSKMAIANLLPRPIESETDARKCMAAAAEFNRNIEQLTGATNTSRTVRLDDCVIDYDADGRGWTKFYPDGTRSRLYLRGQYAADLNVFKEGYSDTSVWVTVHEFDGGLATIHAGFRNPSGSQTISAGFQKPSDSAELVRAQRGDWDRIADPDVIGSAEA